MTDDNAPKRETVEHAHFIDLNNVAQSIEAAVYESTVSMLSTISRIAHERGGCEQANNDVPDAIIGVMSGTLKALWVMRTKDMPEQELKARTMALLSQTLDRAAFEVEQSEAMSQAHREQGARPN